VNELSACSAPCSLTEFISDAHGACASTRKEVTLEWESVAEGERWPEVLLSIVYLFK